MYFLPTLFSIDTTEGPRRLFCLSRRVRAPSGRGAERRVNVILDNLFWRLFVKPGCSVCRNVYVHTTRHFSGTCYKSHRAQDETGATSKGDTGVSKAAEKQSVLLSGGNWFWITELEDTMDTGVSLTSERFIDANVPPPQLRETLGV